MLHTRPKILRRPSASRKKTTTRIALLCSHLDGPRWGTAINGDARSSFDKVTSEIVTPLSLWHRAEQEFGAGCAMYLEQKCKMESKSRTLRDVLARILRAQYIRAVLALQGIPVPDPRLTGHPGPELVTPTDVMLWISQDYGGAMPPDYMTELR